MLCKKSLSNPVRFGRKQRQIVDFCAVVYLGSSKGSFFYFKRTGYFFQVGVVQRDFTYSCLGKPQYCSTWFLFLAILTHCFIPIFYLSVRKALSCFLFYPSMLMEQLLISFKNDVSEYKCYFSSNLYTHLPRK